MSDYGYEIHTAVAATAQMLQPDWTYLEQCIHETLQRALAEQREGIATEIERCGDIEADKAHDGDCYYRGACDSAHIARTFGQTGEDA
jgi:hypothetical protein